MFESEPRAILEELDAHQPFIDVVTPLIDGLVSLDISVNGGSDADKWLRKLRSSSAGMDVVESARDWLELATNRRVRHRDFLDRARRDLATLWPDELDSNTLDLAVYEAAVSALESGGVLPPSLTTSLPQVEVDERLNHVLRGLESEFDDWRHLGWSVDGLHELLTQDPVRLGLDLPEIRVAMNSHDARIARLQPLPWALDIELAERVLADLMRPERLGALDDEYQELMLALSNADGEGDPEFEFKPFRPQMPMARIEEKRAVLVPVVEVEDVELEEVVEEEMVTPVEVIEDEPLVDVEEIVPEQDVPIVVSSHQDIRDLFGLGEDDASLDELLAPPLDVRVQRLARIAFLLEKGGTGGHRALQARLPAIVKKLENWTAERLSRRHASSGGGLLNDAKALGERLADIPGPGAAMPLEMDVFILPDVGDLEGLTTAIKRLERAVVLPSALIRMPESVES